MPSTLQVDKIIDSGSTSDKELAEYSSSDWSWGKGVPNGTVLQVESATKTDKQKIETDFSSSFTDVTGLSVTFTPSSATNYILVMSVVSMAVSTDSLGAGYRFYISGGGTDGVPTGSVGTESGPVAVTSGGKLHASWASYMFSANYRFRLNTTIPNWSSGALTLKIQAGSSDASHDLLINSAGNEGSTNDYMSPISTLTIFEIKG